MNPRRASTPLTLILGPVRKLLERPTPDADNRRSLEVVERNARLLLRHVNDLLDMSKLEAGRMTVDYSDADLAGLVRRVSALFESIGQDRKLTLTVHTPDVCRAQIDPAKIERVLMNLLANAMKVTPAGGRAACALQALQPPDGPARVRLTVSDSGPGIAPEMRDHVFERFFQVEGSSTRRHGGTGLGLSIAKDFVELHLGTIAVDQAPEGGARFIVELPASAPRRGGVRGVRAGRCHGADGIHGTSHRRRSPARSGRTRGAANGGESTGGPGGGGQPGDE